MVVNLKSNVYEIEKNVEKILRGDATGFLLENVLDEVKKRIKKSQYQVLVPYPEAEKVILYGGNAPIVRLFRIECQEEIEHASILGSLFGLNISSEVFGDILWYEGYFYVYLLDDISGLVVRELKNIGRVNVRLVEVSFSYLEDYHRKYDNLELVVSSLRLDTVVSKIVGCNREKAQELIRNKLVLVRYDVIVRPDFIMREGDIFSIRRFGKYRFHEIIGKTKKDNYIISILKYV